MYEISHKEIDTDKYIYIRYILIGNISKSYFLCNVLL